MGKKKIINFFSASLRRENDRNYDNFDQKEKAFKFNRIIGQWKVVVPVAAIAALAIYIVLVYLFSKLASVSLSDITNGVVESATRPKYGFFDTVKAWGWWNLVYWIFAFALSLRFIYLVRISQTDTSQGNKGTSRWATREEIKERYKKIADREIYDPKTKTTLAPGRFPGPGGPPVAREGDDLFIDPTPANTLIIGTSRSGKGEEHVFPSIDIYSRAEEQASMIITDPKLELAPASIPTLQRRGYECHVLNLIDPEYSMGYNPLPVIVEEMKRGDTPAAQQLCNSFAYNVFPNNPEAKDPYWDNQARNILVAAIMADIDDNLAADRELNERRKWHHDKVEEEAKKEAILELPLEQQALYHNICAAEQYLETHPNCSPVVLKRQITDGHLVPEFAKDVMRELSEKEIGEYFNQPKPTIHIETNEYIPTHENENKINLYSIISMVNALHSEKVSDSETQLDLYFKKRPENDFARQTYSAVSSASEQTKGTIMSSFQQKVQIFLYSDIAKMTARSSLNMLDVGFGKKPVAIFIGLPDYDSSNHFIATVFINQLYFTLAKAATAMPGGKTHRDVVFLLDEFGNLPPLDNMESLVSVCLGRGIRFHFILQAFSQLDAKYGPDTAKTVVGNCGIWKFVLTTDQDTAQRVSDIVGKETITTVNRSGKKLAIEKEFTEMTEERALIDATEIMRLKPEETIVMTFLTRTTLDGKPVMALPIKNMGPYKMKFRHKYLLDTFPGGTILYKNKNLKRILERNGDINVDSMALSDVEVETTNNVDLEKTTRSAKKYIAEIKGENKMIRDFPIEEKIKMFDLMDYPQQNREKVEIGEDPKYAFDVFDFTVYARNLIRSKKFKGIGFSLMDILHPIVYADTKTTNRRYASVQQYGQEVMAEEGRMRRKMGAS